MRKVFVATSRPVGERCAIWAEEHLPPGFSMAKTLDDAEIIISVLYDKILGPQYITNKKCFNFHPGVLPEYKGAGAFSWVLINKEKKAGITLHLMDEGIDTGDIIEIREFLISPYDTAHSLFLRGEAVIYKMFKDWFHELLMGEYVAIPQNPKDGDLYLRRDLQRAKNLTRFIKAFHFPGKEAAYYMSRSGKKVYLTFKE